MRRVFLDENVDLILVSSLPDHHCESVRSRGWYGISNGELISKIEVEFDVLISHDQGLEKQQNWKNRKLGLIIIMATSTSYDAYQHQVSRIQDAIAEIKNGQVIHVNLRDE